MSVVDSSVPPALQALLNASESQRQSDESVALAQFAVPGGFEGNDSVATQAALNAAAIRDFLRRIAAANAYGADAGPWIHGLKCLGRDMYGN